MKTRLRRTYQLALKYWKRILLIELIYKAFLLFVLIPFTSFGINFALSLTKYSYITSENIFGFISSPQTILVLCIVSLALALSIQAETSTLFYFYEDCKNDTKHSIVQVIIAGLKSILSIVRRKNYWLPIYVLGVMFFLNIPLVVIIIVQTRIPSYIMQAMLKKDYAQTIIIAVLIYFIVLVYRRIFVLPICILDKKSYREAKDLSIEYTGGHHKNIIVHLIATNILLSVIYVIIYAISFLALILIIYFFAEKGIAVALFLKWNAVLNRYIFILVSMIGFIFNCFLISILYIRVSAPNIKEVTKIEKKADSLVNQEKDIEIHTVYGKFSSVEKFTKWYESASRSQKRSERLKENIRLQVKRISIIFVIVSSLTLYHYFYNMLQNGTFDAEEALLGTQITSHRGDSYNAPENTLPALQAAIDNLADYAEIDVQLTKDGRVVLMHDNTLTRTAGVKRKVSDLTYEELLQYDAGVWFGKEFGGTRIPLLEEVLELCKGKINLNIELKSGSRNAELVPVVVALVEEYEFERQCVITSMSYEMLALVKEYNENLKTGYIMSIAYGNFYDNENIDFFSMKASIVTEELVKVAHRHGKEIHTWTVNSKSDILRMKSFGVDNIITDRPVYVREVLYNTKDTSIRQYVKMILQQ